MPIIKSAKKRVKIAEKATARNNRTRKSIRNSIKALQTAIEKSDKKNIPKLMSEAQSAIDQGVKKNILHKNKAARKKAQLSSKVKAVGVKPLANPKTTAPKKAPAKSTTKAKPVVKKKKIKKKS